MKQIHRTNVMYDSRFDLSSLAISRLRSKSWSNRQRFSLSMVFVYSLTNGRTRSTSWSKGLSGCCVYWYKLFYEFGEYDEYSTKNQHSIHSQIAFIFWIKNMVKIIWIKKRMFEVMEDVGKQHKGCKQPRWSENQTTNLWRYKFV